MEKMNQRTSMERAPNFTKSEKTKLMQIIAQKFKNTLEDKKTDRASVSKKEEAWKKIESEFNFNSIGQNYRSAKSLKKCYENRKKELRKTLAEEKREIMKTGGGAPPTSRRIEDSDEILLSIVNSKTMVGLCNPFDDDAVDISITQTQSENLLFVSSTIVLHFVYLKWLMVI